jgi:hypothetical protein
MMRSFSARGAGDEQGQSATEWCAAAGMGSGVQGGGLASAEDGGLPMNPEVGFSRTVSRPGASHKVGRECRVQSMRLDGGGMAAAGEGGVGVEEEGGGQSEGVRALP